MRPGVILRGTLDAADHELAIAWDAVAGSLTVKDQVVATGVITTRATHTGVWTPGAVDVTPLYLGADVASANAARAVIARLRIFDK